MSVQQRQALDSLLRGSPFDIGGDLVEQRALFHEMIASAPLPEGVFAARGELGPVPVVTVETPEHDASSPVVLYFHGGAYALGSASDFAALVAELSGRAGARGISVDYRLAPENPFPAALDDAVAAYRALLGTGVPPAKVVIAGESSGGGLAVAALVAMRDAGLPLPAGAVVFSPWADLSLSGDSVIGKAGADPVLTGRGLHTRARDYLRDVSPASPLASPVFADLTGLPPLLIQAGSHEILLDDAVRLAARAAKHDVPVQLQVWSGVPHVFQAFAATLDDGDAALSAAAAFARDHWERAARTEADTEAVSTVTASAVSALS